MNRGTLFIAISVLWACVGALDTSAVSAEATDKSPNIALRAPYVLEPAPNYKLCTDVGDKIQLTNGKLAEGSSLWMQPGTVGWQRVKHVSIVVDLGSVQPIQGASFRTAAGTAGVYWPTAIRLQVSDDGRQYRDVGDLINLDDAEGPSAIGYKLHRYATSKLATRGRYIRFLVIPAGRYVFTDEIEVFRGPESLLEKDPSGEPVDNLDLLYARYRVEAGIRLRFDRDLQSLKGEIEAADIRKADRERLFERWQTVRVKLEKTPRPDAPLSFRAILPFNKDHATLFGVRAELWQLQGHAGVHAWPVGPWDPIDLFGNIESRNGAIEVHTMQGEYRAAAFNLANSLDQPVEVEICFSGLPGSSMPDYIDVHEVVWTDTMSGQPVAAALPQARRVGNRWKITVLPGLLQQIWLTFHVTDLPPGEHAGTVVIDGDEYEQHIPVALHVYPLTFPKQTSLWVGGWSYTDGKGRYGITPQNRGQLIEHLREHSVNAPWATSGVLMQYTFAEEGKGIQLDTERFDEWIEQWPDARAYLVFLSVGKSFAGNNLGTEAFSRRVGTWIKAWTDHLRARGLKPDQLSLLLVDEPHAHEQDDVIIAWAKAIKAAETGVLIWEDPVYRNPLEGRPEMFEVSDILCPNRPMWLSAKQVFAKFYLDQQTDGRSLQLYSCSGPARLLDPYSYYRLQAWHCWQIGATGSFFWAFGDNSQSSSWNEFASAGRAYTPLFLDDDTATAAKQMEAIRESAEDYEYFVMLREAVQRARDEGRADETLKEAESLLRNACREVLDAPDADKLMWHIEKDRTRADQFRVRILNTLTVLR